MLICIRPRALCEHVILRTTRLWHFRRIILTCRFPAHRISIAYSSSLLPSKWVPIHSFTRPTSRLPQVSIHYSIIPRPLPENRPLQCLHPPLLFLRSATRAASSANEQLLLLPQTQKTPLAARPTTTNQVDRSNAKRKAPLSHPLPPSSRHYRIFPPTPNSPATEARSSPQLTTRPGPPAISALSRLRRT